MLEGKRRWLDRPSTLFDLLLRADASRGGRRAVRYYEAGIRLAHAAAAVDLIPSPDEIAAIDRFRNLLLGAFDEAGVARPGTPEGSAGHRPATGTAAPEAVTPTPEPPPARPLEELLAELDALVGLVDVKADVRRLTSLLRIQRLRGRARPADDRDEPPPRVHRQSRYRQDHRRPSAEPDPACPRHRVQGPSGRDRPLAPRRWVRRPDGRAHPHRHGIGARRNPARRRGVRAGQRAESRTSGERRSTRSSSSWRTTARILP